MPTLRHTNATMFVTVLSACLGILIVGVPFQVYAQQAAAAAAGESQPATGVPECPDAATPEVDYLLSRNFLSRTFLGLIADVSDLIAKGKLNGDNSSQLEVSLDSTYSGIGTMTVEDRVGNRMFSAVAQDFTEAINADLGFISGLRFYEQDVTHLSVTFQVADSEFVTNVSFKQQSPEQARKLVADFNSMFSVGGCRERGEPAEIFYKNTKALADNDQVLIVTRLPRAALATPLVQKPEAN